MIERPVEARTFKLLFNVAVPPVASVIRKVTEKLPWLIGTPVRMPFGAKEMPGGRKPLAMLNV